MTVFTDAMINSNPLLALALGVLAGVTGPAGLVAALLERRWARLRKRAVRRRPAVPPQPTRAAATSRKARQHRRGYFL